MSSQKKLITIGVVLFLLIRLLSINSLPIFNDEAIYIHWGQEFLKNPQEGWKIPIILAGRQPGLSILLGLSQLTPLDPLVSGRLLSIFFSFLTFITFLYIVKKFDSLNYQTILLFIFTPLLAFFDRLALPESIITFIYTLSLYIAISIKKKPTIIKSIFLGIAIATGWWFKSSILVILPSLLFLPFKSSLIAVTTLIIIISPLLSHPLYSQVSRFESLMLLSIPQLLSFPLDLWLRNFTSVFWWLLIYLTPIIFIRRKNLLLLSFIFVPVVAEIILSKTFYSRYLVMIAPAVCAAAGKIKIKYLIPGILITVLILFSPLGFYRIFGFIPAVSADFSQYVRGWTSGYGVKEAADWLKEKSKDGQLIVYVRADNGNPEDAMYVYLSNEKNITVLPITLLKDAPSGASSYFVSRGPAMAGLDKQLKEITRFNKPLDDEYVGIYAH